MRSNKSSFTWLRLRFRRSLAASLVAFMVWPLLLPALALAASGAIWTTDVTGTVVNKNNYSNGETVYLNGTSDLPAGTEVTYEIRRLPNPVAKTQTITVDANGDWLAVPIFTPAEYGSWINDSHTEFQVNAYYMDGTHRENIGGDNFWVDTDFTASITKTDSADPIFVNQETVYTITVNNLTNATLHNIVVTDVIPAGLEYVSSNPASLDASPSLRWTFPTIEPLGSRIITVTVKGVSPGNHNNVAVMTAEELEGSERDNEYTEVKTQPVYAAEVTKTDSADPIFVGENTTYTIKVTNTGDSDLTDVEVTDVIPAGLGYVSSNPASLDASPSLRWTFPTIEPGAENAKVITVVVKGVDPGNHNNVAVMTAEELEGSERDNEYTEVRQRQYPFYDIGITKTASADRIAVGENTTYTITVANTGNTNLTDVHVTDIFPEGLDYVSSSPGSLTSTPTLSWHFSTLEPGAENAEVITVNANGRLVGTHTNTAVVDSDQLDPKSSSVDTLVYEEEQPPPPPRETTYTITKTDSSDPVIVGENTTYTITVNNTGETTLTGVSVYDAMPAGLEYVSAEPAPYITSPLGWHLPDLGPGANYVIKVRAKALTVGTWTNSAHVHVGELPAVYAYEDTNVSSKPTVNETTPSVTPLLPPVVAPATFDLSIKKVDDVDPAYVGDTVTYTMTVRNSGNQPLTGLAFKDSLPTGMPYKSSASGISKQSSPGVYVWSLAKLDSGASRTFKISTTAGKVGIWTNTVSVTANEIPTAREADEKTKVLARLAQAAQISDASLSSGTSGSLPFTGFPLTLWLFTAVSIIASGIWLEITSRRKALNN